MDERTRRLEREALAGDDAARVELALCYLRAGRHAEAHALTTGRSDPEAAALAAVAAYELGRTDEAADAAALALRGGVSPPREGLCEELAAALLSPAPAPDAPPDDPARLQALRRCAGLGPSALASLEPLLASPAPLVRAQLALHEALAPRLARDPDPVVRLAALRRCADLGALGRAVLAASVVDPDPLVRAQAARHPELAARLAEDACALVRHVARGAPALPPFPREPVPTRLFGAHGRDFETGLFIGLEASTDGCLAALDAAGLRALARTLGHEGLTLARGRGYGLGLPAHAPRGELEARARCLDQAGVLPFPLLVSWGQMFDVIKPSTLTRSGALPDPEDESLAELFARDLTRHPARLEARPPARPYVQLLCCYPPGRAEPHPDGEALLATMPASYGRVGCRALQRFVELALSQSQAGLKRPRDSSAV